MLNKVESNHINLHPAPYKSINGTKWGYINNRGMFVIKPKYDYANAFQGNGLAVVDFMGLYGVIDSRGEYAVTPKYESISEFSQGRAAVIDKGKFKVIDEKGTVITSRGYSFIGQYKEGRAIFMDDSNLYGYLDRNEKEIIPAKYISASDFKDGKAVVKVKEKEYSLVDTDGKVLQTYNYFFVGSLGDELLSFQERDQDKFGYIDIKGNVVIKPNYTGAEPFNNGRAVVNAGEDFRNEFGLIDRGGNFIISPEYGNISFLGENRVSVGVYIDKEKPYIGLRYALADINGDFLTNFIYSSIENYNLGAASVSNKSFTFFIDKGGKLIENLPTVRGDGSLIIEGDLIKAFTDNRIAYYNTASEFVWKQNKVIPLNYNYRVKERKFKPNKDYLVYYPEVLGMKDKASQEAVNKKLMQLSNIKDIKEDVQLESSYSGDFSVEFFQKNLLVLELDAYDFTFGAAHGMPSRVYPHIDLVAGKFYELKDLFKENSDYVKVLSGIIGNQIKNDSQYEYVFPDAYKGIKENQPFYVDKDALYIYFEPYEIAPYAAGFPTFKIPYKDIMNIINTEGEFWRAFK